MRRRRRVAAGPALDRLERAFGRPRPGRRLPPLDELVLTILSQNTSDTNSGRAFRSLRRALPTWERVLAARPPEVERAIRVGGLSRVKSRVILETLARLRSERGRLDLGFLRRLPTDEARRYLMTFRGVGEKTACCVLLFACGRPAFPVDTHILRITRRLGWIPPRADARAAHATMATLVPPSRTYTAHVNLITLGRRFCRPRTPLCPVCPLRPLCPYGRRLFPGRLAAGRRAPLAAMPRV